MSWHRGWSVLAVAMLFQAVTFGIGIYSFTFWVEPWSSEFEVGRGDVMTVFLTMQVVMGLTAPLAGRAMDRLSIRGLITAGTLCLATALALAGQASALWHLNLIYGTLMVTGMLLAGPLAAQKLATKWFSKQRGMALGVASVGTSIGGLLVPPLVTALQAELGWRTSNDLLALLTVVIVVPPVWWLLRHENPTPTAGDALELDAQGPDSDASEPSLSYLDVLRRRVFWLTVLAFTPLVTAFGGAHQNLAPYAADQGIDAQAAAFLVSIMAFVMIAAKIFFGFMADRWQLRTLLFLVIGVQAVTFGLMVGELTYATLALVCGLLGFVAGGFLPLLGAMVSQNFNIRAFGQVMGLIGPFTTLAAVGPWIAGYLRDTAGSYDIAWMVFAVLLIPSALATALMKPRQMN